MVRLAKVLELTLDEIGLTTNQYRALTLVAQGAPALREFAYRLAMQPPNVTTLIDGLAQRHLVIRSRDRTDGRRVVLSLTPAGRALLQHADTRCDRALEHIASFDDAGALLDGLDRWRPALDAVAVDVRRLLQSASEKIPGEKS